MTAFLSTDQDLFTPFDETFYNDSLQNVVFLCLNNFRSILRSHALCTLIFVLLLAGELSYLAIHLIFLSQSFFIALYVALIFATLFCCLALHTYLETRKKEKLKELQDYFVSACRKLYPRPQDVGSHIALAQACCKMATTLDAEEYTILSLPRWLNFLKPLCEQLNARYFWRDVHDTKESFLQACLQEHLALVRIEPTSLEAHAGLANAHVMLSGLYVDPRTVEGLDDDRWIPPKKYTPAFREHFRAIAEKAVEEFKILSHYAPQDPWVHTQLAYSYRDLQMPKEEIHEYEILLQLCPEDKEILFKLGKLYFEQGQNAKGLQMYEQLKTTHHKKAESLIRHYGT